MKKIVWLLLITVIAVGVIVYGGYISRPQTVPLRTVTLTAAPIRETVSCKGRVEETEQTAVQAQTDCVVDEVKIKNGQHVKKGDVLFTVDKAATLSALATADGAAAVHSAMQDTVIDAVTAPCDGMVSELIAENGQALSSEQVCAVIEAYEPVQIRLSIPERKISRVALGQRVQVTGIGFSKEQYSGYITHISSSAKQEQNAASTETTVEAVVTLDEGQSDGSLRVGLTAKGIITVATVPVGFVLPYEAICVDEDNEEFVYILENNTAKKRQFTPLAELPNGYLVTENFSDREKVIVEPGKVKGDTMYLAKETDDD